MTAQETKKSVMKRIVSLKNDRLAYNLHRRRGTRRISLTVNCDAEVVVTAPRWVPIWQLENFIKEKTGWLLGKIEWVRSNPPARNNLRGTREEYLSHKSRALLFVRRKLAEINEIYDFSYKRISIRNQKSRWGSCSRAGVLSFNYKIALLPEDLAEYVVIHEFCHLGEMNHSKKFWALVARTTPDYTVRRRNLRLYRDKVQVFF